MTVQTYRCAWCDHAAFHLDAEDICTFCRNAQSEPSEDVADETGAGWDS